jgi:hypothetical protein
LLIRIFKWIAITFIDYYNLRVQNRLKICLPGDLTCQPSVLLPEMVKLVRFPQNKKKHENVSSTVILQAGASSAAHESEIEQMKRKASGNWTLEGDAFLLGFMKNISNVSNTHPIAISPTEN